MYVKLLWGSCVCCAACGMCGLLWAALWCCVMCKWLTVEPRTDRAPSLCSRFFVVHAVGQGILGHVCLFWLRGQLVRDRLLLHHPHKDVHLSDVFRVSVRWLPGTGLISRLPNEAHHPPPHWCPSWCDCREHDGVALPPTALVPIQSAEIGWSPTQLAAGPTAPNQQHILEPDQPYDVVVSLRMPDSKANLDAGVFSSSVCPLLVRMCPHAR